MQLEIQPGIYSHSKVFDSRFSNDDVVPYASNCFFRALRDKHDLRFVHQECKTYIFQPLLYCGDYYWWIQLHMREVFCSNNHYYVIDVTYIVALLETGTGGVSGKFSFFFFLTKVQSTIDFSLQCLPHSA